VSDPDFRTADGELVTRFTHHPPKDVGPRPQATRYAEIREQALAFARLVNDCCPESREKSLAFTKIEEAVMWANSAIARRE
jgi:hypothetical protein